MRGKTFLVILTLFSLGLIKNYWLLEKSMFESDQEYLALSGQSILKGDFTLIGAPTSIGGIFIGPLYNYVAAFFLAIFHGNPLVVNGLSDFWAAITIPTIYLVGRKLYSEQAGLFAAVMALLSIQFINQTDVPPLLFPIPFLSLLFLWILKSSYSRQRKSLLLGTLTGLLLNLHFSGIFFTPFLFGVGWLWIIPLGLLLSPLLVFELRNAFIISRHLFQFLASGTGAGSSFGYRLDTYLQSVSGLLYPIQINRTMMFGLLIAVIVVFLKKRQYLESAFFLSPLFFFLIYSGHLLPYYSVMIWPMIFLILGRFLAWIRKLGNVAALVVLVAVVMYGIPNINIWHG